MILLTMSSYLLFGSKDHPYPMEVLVFLLIPLLQQPERLEILFLPSAKMKL